MGILDEAGLTGSIERRKAWEKSVAGEKCPNCKHPKTEHCSRNTHLPKGACCPGYCFVDEECKCPGWAAEGTC